MCIETKKILTTVKEKKVFKVLRHDKTTLFFRIMGVRVSSLYSEEPQPFPLDVTLSSVGFKKGYGFHCFASKKTAEKYCVVLHKDSLSYGLKGPLILEAIIPTSTKYGKGVIFGGLLGKHLPALRTDKIIVHDKIVT